jgi:signal transduction histidine kinase
LSDSRSHDGKLPPEEENARSDERQQIARELDDATFQLLPTLKLNLNRLESVGGPDVQSLVKECEQLVKEIGDQIRALRSE